MKRAKKIISIIIIVFIIISFILSLAPGFLF